MIVPTISPLFTYVLTILLFKKKSHIKEVVGLIVGFLGGVLLIRVWEISPENIVSSGNFGFI